MKLCKLSVSGWRCFSTPVELADFSHGLNIVHGPNGIGKSSLFKTLVHVFGDRFKSKADPLKSLQSWGTDLSPRALIEFEHGDERWRIEKQFLTGALARLAKWNGKAWSPIAENESADDRIREMLHMEMPGRSGITPNQWGLAQMLWAEQGAMQLGALSDPARTLIQQSLGAQLVGTEGTEVESRVEAAFDQFFTGTGKDKTGSPLRSFRDELKRAEETVAELRQKLQSFDDASRIIEDLRVRAAEAQSEEQQLAVAEATAQAQATAYAALVQQRELAANQLKATKADAEQKRQRLEEIAAARREVTRWQEEVAKLQAAEDGLKGEVALRQKLVDDAAEQLKQVRAGRSAIDLAHRKVQQAERLVKARRQLDVDQQLLQEVNEFTQQQEVLQQQRKGIIAPDSKQLSILRKAFRDRDDARLRFEASLITIEIQTEVPAEIELTHGEATNHPGAEHQLSAGEVWIARGSPEVALRLKGIASIRACGPAGSADVNRELWNKAETQLEKLTAGWQTQDLAALEAAAEQGAELDQQLRVLATRIETLLGKRTIEDLQRDCSLAARQVEELLAEEPAWRVALPDVALLREAEEKLVTSFKSAIDRAEQQKEIAEAESKKTLVRSTQVQSDLQNAQKQVLLQEARLVQWTSDGLSDEVRHEVYQSAALEFAAAQGQLKAAEDKLAAAGPDPRDTARVLQEKGVAFRKIAQDALKSMHLAEGELKRLTDDSPYSKLAEAEEQAGRLREELTRLEVETQAIKLLHETLQTQRRNLVDSLVGPVQQRAVQFLHRIVDEKFGDLEFDQQFAATGIYPRAQEEAVPLTQLSGGEREQVHFAVRLALAEIAFPDGNQLIVLDDVFTFTDRGRLARVATILAELSERFQVVLLTCHPERYQELASAKFFDLEQLGDQGVPAPTVTLSQPSPRQATAAKDASAKNILPGLGLD